jgi:hypothetical protein
MIRQERDTGCPTPQWWPCRQHQGRGDALRDALYLRRASNDPGPDGRLLQGLAAAGRANPQDKAVVLGPKDRMSGMLDALDLPHLAHVLAGTLPESTCDRRSHLA